MTCTCDPVESGGYTYIQWAGTYFNACIYTPRDQAGFYFGLLNIVLWLFAQVPQIWENFKLKRAESLSLGFMITWLLGDITNLVGCILTNQYPVQLYTAYYFILVDFIMLTQAAYYRWMNNRKQLLLDQDDEEHWIETSAAQPPPVNSSLYGALLLLGGVSLLLKTQSAPESGVGRSLLQTDDDADLCNSSVSVSNAVEIIGIVCAWISGVLYFTARFPQIMHNEARKSTEGLSLTLFLASSTANIFYGMSIILPDTTDWRSADFWKSTFPYLLGSLGTVASTIPILVQFYRFRDPENPSNYSRLNQGL